MRGTHNLGFYAAAALLACGLLPASAATPAKAPARPKAAAKTAKPPEAPYTPRRTPLKPAQTRIDDAVDALLQQADARWHDGDYEGVNGLYTIINNLDPTYVEGWQDRGWLLWAGLDRPDEAMRVLHRGLGYNPDAWEMYFEIGYLHHHQRHFLTAAQWFGKATAHGAPMYVYHMRAHALEYAGQIDKAKAAWKQIIAKFPNDPPAPLNLKRIERGDIRREPLLGVEPAPGHDKPLPRPEPTEPEITGPQDPNSI